MIVADELGGPAEAFSSMSEVVEAVAVWVGGGVDPDSVVGDFDNDAVG